ncbi:putative cyanobacterial aminoacyl-tRNA synthetase, CAAD domain, protein CURVATURE THYLAKOID 1 [Helianthus annuus]|uniref:Cyanobacterial aminoacyl-tRNA synthetase, CAAD domain, protein CURVATURE THYLAKOID 1 n=1 Tax=Helianthus annuus TaxID=4232 RepID=A0A251V1U2_HELAN|nr:protein CURVATURE THYLAKOID 1B, chloroplastic [Helianthus annuus]KAF5811451.1 putative cyanobacterial aminoacyl-tRNA synthetase, CAAD domain, protein CURVATURE THYLAKOID 1 [Helianthus annuus]KAJ0582090.1 putative cyanobacterial aminoacyl-tRNA synthetase, CAAD domain, protein CURVATURE THYLAKOID 1 [Helianthus annuus]KAJ0590249.1 putative cyanobacterial aminoacyl-tRNA synthetase, CAAD domain, protein CURVATURE THYLAKOID 1 [Helianthus annuus]KAJ0598075.1 putative cyanobacterial aminoacyl-tRNA s
MATTIHSMSTTSTTLIDGKAPLRQSAAAASSQCVTLPPLPPRLPLQQKRVWNTTGYSRKLARNVAAMATGEATPEAGPPDAEELIKPIQEAWEKVEDKYAVSSLVVAGVVFLWGSTGLISAIDRLPLIPGVLELVGIGYTGWFVYKNLIYKPDREALVEKIKGTYKDIIGSS